MLPFTQKRLRSGALLREFKEDVDASSLVWHRDKHDRNIRVVRSDCWKIQVENQLPVEMKPGDLYFIPERTYHRIIKGKGKLVVEIDEVFEKLSLMEMIDPSAVQDSVLPKGEWVLLQKGDPRREVIKNSLYDMVCQTYAPIGGHFKICDPQSLDRYVYWVVKDLDNDADPDVALLGKPDIAGQKMGAAANDGSPAASAAYKDKSAELRSGGSIDGVGNWWGEVSGKPAYAMLKRGALAVEDEAKVAQLLAGDDYVFHGEHPDPNAPPLFKSVRGWYTKKFSGKSSTKIILGNPA